MQRRHWALEVLRKEGVRSVSILSSLLLSLSSAIRDQKSSGTLDLVWISWKQEDGDEKGEGNGLIQEQANDQVLDIGCGTGSLLETLVIPPSTIHEPPIRSSKASTPSSSSSSNSVEDEDEDRELFILVRPPSPI